MKIQNTPIFSNEDTKYTDILSNGQRLELYGTI